MYDKKRIYLLFALILQDLNPPQEIQVEEEVIRMNAPIKNQNKGNDIFTKLKALNKFSYILPTFEEQVIDINNNVNL